MAENLEQALSAPAIAAALRDAERELADLKRRQRELEQLIARARVALGLSDETTARSRQLKLHEAIEQILDENANRWMHVKEIAASINQRRLYSKRDDTDVELGQIYARTRHAGYSHRFERDGPMLRRAHS